MGDDDGDLMVDLLDRGGRLRRFLVAFSVGVAIAIGVGIAMYRHLHADRLKGRYETPHAWRTIFYVAFLSGAAVFVRPSPAPASSPQPPAPDASTDVDVAILGGGVARDADLAGRGVGQRLGLGHRDDEDGRARGLEAGGRLRALIF